MLRKGQSIARLCEEHPSYTSAALKTFYGKKNMIGSNNIAIDVLNNDSCIILTDMPSVTKGEIKLPAFGARERRNKSVALTAKNVLTHGISDLDFGTMSLDDDDSTVKKVLTKFPPPPYLPGEVERRKALLIDKSDLEL